MMKRTSTLLLALALAVCARGQQPLQSASTTFGAGAAGLADGYLSPLPYDGWGLRVAHTDRRYLRQGQTRLSSLSRVRVQGGMALNPARTASMMFAGADYTWGLYWHFRPAEGLQLLAGGTAGAELGVKYLARNVNNPANVDAALDVNAAATVIYDIPLRRRTLRLQADVESPLMGCMFAPAQGSSYYEIFSLRAEGRFVHFTAPHNRRGVRADVFVEMPFARSTWRVGFSGGLRKWTANGLVFSRREAGLYLGFTRTLAAFNRRQPAPEGFVGI